MKGKDVITLLEAGEHEAKGIDAKLEYAPMSFGEFRRLWRKFNAWCRRVEPDALANSAELVDFVTRHRRPVEGETPIVAEGSTVRFVSPEGFVITVNAETGWIPEVGDVEQQETTKTGADDYAGKPKAGKRKARANRGDALPAGA
jgi:hypothetical protein